jgi:DNA-binding NarL/FixJ family response regulator
VGWWAARAFLAAGEADDSDEGIADLLRARVAFEEMGASGWRERAESALRDRGVRWSSRRLDSQGLLSARELEVVRHLTAGYSNAAIAERLVLSENTVARHLTRIYRKLGVSSRVDAVIASRELVGGDADG